MQQMKKPIKRVDYILPIFLLITLFILISASRQVPSSIKKPYSLSDARFVTTALAAIQKEYLERDRIVPRQMLNGALDEVEKRIPEILAQSEESGTVAVTVDVATKRFSFKSLDSLGDLKKALQEILAFIDTHYQGDTERPEIEYAAIDGLLTTLDPHSAFLPPKVYSEFKIGTKGEFGGLGIVISVKDGNLTVIAPLDGTPAARAGIKAGDRIVQIDDESAINMSLTDAVNKLRGDVGTKVKIVLERPGRTEPITMVLTRALINIDSVQSALLEQDGKRIGYLKVKNFQSNTNEDVEAALNNFHRNNIKLDGLILDLRNNPGGLLNQAIDLADHFISKGTIVSTVGIGDTVLDSNEAHERGTQPPYPIAVLINEGSASASEIVAGAIKELDRGIVIGRRSFGKGSVQTIFETGDGAAIKLTIAKYLPAGTRSIQSVGLSPDIELQPVTVDRKAMDLVEDEIVSEKTLEKHLEESSKVEPSAYRVRFLLPRENEKETEEAKSAKEYAKKPKIEDDFAVTLARDLLSHVLEPRRKAMLNEISTTVEEAKSAQESEIAKRLQALGIDWSGGKELGHPQLKVAFDIKKGATVLKEIRAGAEAMLELKVTNIGDSPFFKLIGTGKSDSPLLVNKEFVYGKLLPGETRSSQVALKVPDALPTEELSMEVKFQDEYTSIPTAINVVVPIKGKKLPTFGFNYRLQGSALKPMKPGVPVRLDVDVTNLGSGLTNKDTVAQISNKSGEKVFIEVGRATIGKLAPAASKKASFRFHLKPEFSEKEVKLELSIFDSMRVDSVTQKMRIDTETGVTSPPAGKLYEPPVVEIAQNPLATNDDQLHLKGTVRDNEAVRDYFIFVGDKKVAYVSNPSQTNAVPIDVTVPLKPGLNMIYVAARDFQNLTGRTLIAIERTSGKKEEKAAVETMPLIPEVSE